MNESIISKTSEYFNKKGIILPTISELANPHIINQEYKDSKLFRSSKLMSKKIYYENPLMKIIKYSNFNLPVR